MTKKLITYPLLLTLISLVFFSCGSSKGGTSLYNPKEVAHLSRQLQIPLSNKDKEDDKNMSLYAEVSLWLGTPYRYGGTTKRGTDCSGFIMQVYKKLYNKKLPRSTAGLAKAKYKKVAKRNLKSGDIILFATGKNKRTVSHAGIYLKNGKFIHASSSRGVIINDVDDDYYKRTWVRAIRVK